MHCKDFFTTTTQIKQKETKVKIYTMKDLMKILKLSEVTVRKLIKEGKIKKLDTDRAVRVTEESLNNFLNSTKEQ